MFPNVPTQSGYNKRVRAAGVLIAAVITELARDTPSWHEDLRLLDSTPVPCGKSREQPSAPISPATRPTATAPPIHAISGASGST